MGVAYQIQGFCVNRKKSAKIVVTFSFEMFIEGEGMIMNIDLNAQLNMRRVDVASVKQPAEGVAQAELSERADFFGSSLKVTAATPAKTDALDELRDTDLRRDDDLGQLMTKAFDFQPPEMPNFV